MKLLPVLETRDRGNLSSRNTLSRFFHQVHSKPMSRQRLHTAEAPHQRVLNTIKDQPWVWRPKLIQYDLTLSETEEYGSYHDGKEYKTIHYRSLQKYLKELICRGFLKKYIPTPEIDAGFGQTLIPPPTQSQHTISQYKSIEWSNLTTINMAVPPFLTHPVSQFHVFHFSIE